MNRIVPSDISMTLAGFGQCDHALAREIARKCNEIAVRRNVAEWELSAEGAGMAKALYFDGWDAAGREVSHAKVWSL